MEQNLNTSIKTEPNPGSCGYIPCSAPLGVPALIMHNGILLNGCKILHYDSRQKIVSILLADGHIVKEHYGSVAYAELVKAVSFLKFRHLSREEKMLCFGTYHFNRRYRRWRSRARKIVQGRRRIRMSEYATEVGVISFPKSVRKR